MIGGSDYSGESDLIQLETGDVYDAANPAPAHNRLSARESPFQVRQEGWPRSRASGGPLTADVCEAKPSRTQRR